MSSSSAPKPASELVVLGSLSKAPNFFPKEGDEEDGATFWSPVDIYHDAIGLVSSTAVGIAQAAVMDTQNTFPGLAQFRSETTAISQVVGRASDISDNFPPIWYINFSPDMGDWQRRELNERVQAMKDFKCWSSLKWWADVFKEIPTTRDHANKMRQSTAFVFLAMRDLYSLDWFQSQTPTVLSETIECPMPDLHARIIQMAFNNFQRVDDITRRALEPVFEGVLNSASDMTVDYQDQRVVMAEKHEFKSQTNSIVSTIRLIAFEISESFYDVQGGKNTSRKMVRCQVEFVQFDAEFNVARWKSFAKSIASDQKTATEDFISRQTININV